MIQLKPHRESFYAISRKAPRLKAIVVCEGQTDTEIIKEVAKKLGYKLGNHVAITDCEGIDNIPIVVSSLAKLSRSLSTLAIVIDLDDKEASERIESLINSLRSHSIEITDPKLLNQKVFASNVARGEQSFNIVVTLMGLEEIPVEKHSIEDHVIKLMALKGSINLTSIQGIKSSKQLIDNYQKIAPLINKACEENIRSAFQPIVSLLKLIQEQTALK